MIRDNLKEIVNLQHIIKTDNLIYKSRSRKIYNFNEYSLSVPFLRDIYEGYLSLKDPYDEQSNFTAKINNLDQDKKNN